MATRGRPRSAGGPAWHCGALRCGPHVSFDAVPVSPVTKSLSDRGDAVRSRPLALSDSLAASASLGFLRVTETRRDRARRRRALDSSPDETSIGHETVRGRPVAERARSTVAPVTNRCSSESRSWRHVGGSSPPTVSPVRIARPRPFDRGCPGRLGIRPGCRQPPTSPTRKPMLAVAERWTATSGRQIVLGRCARTLAVTPRTYVRPHGDRRRSVHLPLVRNDLPAPPPRRPEALLLPPQLPPTGLRGPAPCRARGRPPQAPPATPRRPRPAALRSRAAPPHRACPPPRRPARPVRTTDHALRHLRGRHPPALRPAPTSTGGATAAPATGSWPAIPHPGPSIRPATSPCSPTSPAGCRPTC